MCLLLGASIKEAEARIYRQGGRGRLHAEGRKAMHGGWAATGPGRPAMSKWQACLVFHVGEKEMACAERGRVVGPGGH